MYREEEYLMLSGIQHFAFCRRQWALIHIEQQWKENYLTLEGQFMHEKAHETGQEVSGDKIIVRNMPVQSHELGIMGVCDVLEFCKDPEGITLQDYKGTWIPMLVEYKRGKPKEYNADILQLCAQALCLEEMLVCTIQEGSLFYGETRRRTVVEFDLKLRAEVKEMFVEMHEYFRRGHTPKSKQKPICKNCSLKDICLPKMSKLKASSYLSKTVFSEDDV